MSEDQVLKPAKAWQHLTFKDFSSRISYPFQINIKLPESIENRLHFVHKILQLAYYEQQLMDVAFREILLTFELALRLRYTELTKTDSKKKSLEDLINWATGRDLFVAAKHNVHAFRLLRNGYFHPNRFQMALGPMALKGIYGTVDNIVDLFHDEEMHKNRIAEEKRIQRVISEFEESGFVIDDSISRTIIIRAVLAVFDNRLGRSVYHFIFWPIFDTNLDDHKFVNLLEPILIDATEVKILKSGVQLIGNQAITLKNLTQTEKGMWNKFKMDFSADEMSGDRSLLEMQIGHQRWKVRRKVFWPNQFKELR